MNDLHDIHGIRRSRRRKGKVKRARNDRCTYRTGPILQEFRTERMAESEGRSSNLKPRARLRDRPKGRPIGAVSVANWRETRKLAEREGFEPPMELPPCRISSAVHSTTLPPLRICGRRILCAGVSIAAGARQHKSKIAAQALPAAPPHGPGGTGSNAHCA